MSIFMTPTAGDKSPKSIANQCCKYFPFAMQQIISLTRKGKTPEKCVCAWGKGCGEVEKMRVKNIYMKLCTIYFISYTI